MRTTPEYLSLITSEHQGKPKFAASLTAAVDPLASVQQFLASLPAQFDVDTAVGVQLDIVGLWIGRSRKIPTPIADPWFRFDDVLRGFDSAYWYQPAYGQQTYLSVLDDDTYRRLLKAKILANRWDGTRPGAEAVLDTYFTNPNTLIWVQDNSLAATQQIFFAFDDPNQQRGLDQGVWYVPGETVSTIAKTAMSMTIGVAGQWPNIVDLEILNQQLLPIKPGGVALDVEVTSINGASLFGFDVENEFIAGFDVGALGVSPSELISTQLNG
jgi:hypothetical protein